MLVVIVSGASFRIGREPAALSAAGYDLGGTPMNESIKRATSGIRGQEFDAAQLQALVAVFGRPA